MMPTTRHSGVPGRPVAAGSGAAHAALTERPGKTPRPAPTRHAAVRGARGVTLIELLVSVLVLVIMILAFSAILSQGQQVVSTSQRIIRANAQAAAVAQVFRRDIASLTADGFLHINSSSEPALVFTAVGPYVSRNPPAGVTDVHANAAVICYSTGNDTSTGGGGAKSILCRETHLLIKPAGVTGAWTPASSDVMLMYLSDIQQDLYLSRPTTIVSRFRGAADIPTLPATLAEVKQTWPVLVAGCTNISVWCRYAGSTSWANTTRTWTYADRDNWPVAIKIKFDISGRAFEVICPITR